MNTANCNTGFPRHLCGVAAICMMTASIVVAQPTAAPDDPQPEASSAVVQDGITRENGGLLLNFQDASINAVLDELSASAGFVVVKEVRPEGRITLVSRQPIDLDTTVSLLNTVLRNGGYAAIQQGRILKIVRSTDAKRLSIPVRVGNDPAKIVATDELITQVIPLRYADATQLKTDLQPLISTDADFASNQSSNALVITDTSANVRRVVEIVAALDTSLADAVDVKIFQLKYANAANAAKLINDVFANLDVSGQQQQGEFVPPWRRNERSQQQQQQAGGRSTTKVSASADDRTNAVVVSGPADTLAAVGQILKDLDANPAEDEKVFVYRLRNAQSLNVESVINSLFNGTAPTNRGTTASPGGTYGGSPLQRSSRTSGGGTLGGGGSGAFGAASGLMSQAGTNRFGNQQVVQAAARLSPAATQAASDLAGLVSIIADPDTNSLLVRTSPVHYERVKLVLDELDKPVAQVLIKVLIAEVTHDNGYDIGAEFSVLNIRPSGLGSEAGTSFNIPTAGAAATGMIVQVMEENISATIRLLETQGKLDVLSRPYILASDNQLASITVGQEVPFITNSRITDTGQTINTIEYGDVGILLDVMPHINPDGLVILDVAPEISTLTGTTVPISELVSAPVIAKRSAVSRVGVKNGQTVVIGGLMEDRVTTTVNKVPLLGDVPIVGNAFKRVQNNKTKTELLIFLTPHVAAAPDALGGMSQDEVGGTKLLPEAVAPGVYEEHREGLKRGADPTLTPPSADVPAEDRIEGEEPTNAVPPPPSSPSPQP